MIESRLRTRRRLRSVSCKQNGKAPIVIARTTSSTTALGFFLFEYTVTDNSWGATFGYAP